MHPDVLLSDKTSSLVCNVKRGPIIRLTRELGHRRARVSTPDFGGLVTSVPRVICLSGRMIMRRKSVALFSRRRYLGSGGGRTTGFHRVRRRDGGCATSHVLRGDNGLAMMIGPPCPPLARTRLSHSFSLPCAHLPRPGCGKGHVPTCSVVGFSIGLRHKYFKKYTFYAVSTRRNGFVMDHDGRDVLGRIGTVARLPSFGNCLDSLKNPSTGVCHVGKQSRTIYEGYGHPSYVCPGMYPGLGASRHPLLSVCRTMSTLPNVGGSFVNDNMHCSLLLRRDGSPGAGGDARRCAHRLVTHRIDNHLGMTPRRASSHILGVVHGPPFDRFNRFGGVFSEVGRRRKLHRRLVPCFVDDRPKYGRRSVTRLTIVAGQLSFRLRRIRSFAPAPVAITART